MKKKANGFTVVELISTIVIVALISASVSSRWFSDDAYNVSTASSQLVSIAHLAQKISMSHGGVDIHLQISQQPDQWRYSIIEDDGGVLTTLHQFEVEGRNIDIDVTAGIGPTTLSTGTDLDLEYDSLGNVSDIYIGAVQGTVSSGIAILLSGSFDNPVCISPLGFAHDGSCV